MPTPLRCPKCQANQWIADDDLATGKASTDGTATNGKDLACLTCGYRKYATPPLPFVRECRGQRDGSRRTERRPAAETVDSSV